MSPFKPGWRGADISRTRKRGFGKAVWRLQGQANLMRALLKAVGMDAYWFRSIPAAAPTCVRIGRRRSSSTTPSWHQVSASVEAASIAVIRNSAGCCSSIRRSGHARGRIAGRGAGQLRAGGRGDKGALLRCLRALRPITAPRPTCRSTQRRGRGESAERILFWAQGISVRSRCND